MAITAAYLFNWWLLTDYSWNWYTLTNQNTATNPIWFQEWWFKWNDSITYEDIGWTNEWGTLKYLYYSWWDMWISSTQALSFEWMLKVTSQPTTWQSVFICSKQKPWTSYNIYYTNEGWTYKLVFNRNRDYIWSDGFKYTVTLTTDKRYYIVLTYSWSYVYWYLEWINKWSQSSSWTWNTTTYTWFRVWTSSNNYWNYSWWCIIDNVFLHNIQINDSYIKNKHSLYKWFFSS